MIATLCSHLSGNPVQHGIKILDGFTKLCSNYRNGVLLASGKNSDGSPIFVTSNAKVVNLRAMIRYGWALMASVFFCGLQVSCEKSGKHI